MGNHTPEPWQTGREDLQSYHGHSGEPFSSIYRRDDDERMPLTTDGFGGLTRVPLRIAYIEGKDIPREEEKANARRIVACVNALAGIPDPAAYMASLMSIRVTIDTPNEVCDGKVTDTIGNLIKRYGQECLDWIVEATPESEAKPCP